MGEGDVRCAGVGRSECRHCPNVFLDCAYFRSMITTSMSGLITPHLIHLNLTYFFLITTLYVSPYSSPLLSVVYRMFRISS